jgi:hypothetical protein
VISILQGRDIAGSWHFLTVVQVVAPPFLSN